MLLVHTSTDPPLPHLSLQPCFDLCDSKGLCLLLTAISKIQFNEAICNVCKGESIQRMDELI